MANSEIRVKHGTTYNGAEFTITVNGVPLDLTGATLLMQVRFWYDTAVIHEYSLGSGLTLSDPTNGKFMFDNQVVNIPPSSYKYDVLITLANGTKKIYAIGNFVVETVITHG